jgi:hypothetical protein
MDDPARNAVAERTCTQCGTRADAGLIFCKKCGTALQTPAPLIQSGIAVPRGNYSAEPKAKRVLLKWLFLATVLILGYFMWQCGSGMRAGARLSDDAVRHFHSQLDSEAYGDIVRDSDEAFQKSDNRDEIIKFLSGVHSKLGLTRGFTRANIFVNAGTNGTFIKVTYQSTFDHGNALEAFTWKKAGGGLKLVRYDVNSNAFLTR